MPQMPSVSTASGNLDRGLLAREMRRRVAASGFTIVEVMVAMGVVLILLYVISILFTQVGKASDMILVNYAVSNYNTALGAQLRDDVRRVNKNGFMVIRNQAIKDPATGQWTNMDQIVFLTSGEAASQMYNLQWVQPDGSTGGDSGLQRSFTATDSRVWYGHLATSTTMGYGANDPVGNFAQVDSRLWALGRQQLLLAGKFVSLDTVTPAKAPANSIWFNHLATASATTANYFGGGARTLTPFANGKTDLIADPLYASPSAIRSAIVNPNGDIDPTTAAADAPILDNSLAPWIQPWYPTPPAWGSLTAYQRMEAAAFRPYGQRKLPAITTTLAEDIMQTQLILAPYCSNFKVEFAGDYVSAQNPIPATRQVDGQTDIYRGGATGTLPNGDYTTETAPYTVYWYGGGFDGPVNAVPAPARRYIQPANNTVYGDGVGAPMLNTRIAAGTTGGGIDWDLYTATFGYDKTVTPWPRLLKITVNLQDDKGRLRENFKTFKDPANANFTVADGKQFQYLIEVPQ